MPKPKSMRQGSPVDFQTPNSAIEPLLPYLKKEWIIWEPACGKGNIVKYLTLKEYFVIGTDILTGEDFLNYIPEDFSCIITNPPYTLKQQFLERCYQLGKPFALLLPLTTFETQKRQNLFKTYGIEVLFLPERVRFETPSGRKEDESSPWFATCWVTWKLNLPNQMNWYSKTEESSLL